MKNKVKLIGLVIVIALVVTISLAFHISLNSRNGGVLLLPFLYVGCAWVIPHIARDIYKDIKECATEEITITKNQFTTKCFKEAFGEIEIEETTLKGEIINENN